jgi:hypothetical protein
MDYATYSRIADEAAQDCKSPEHGIAVTVDYDHLRGFRYCIWTVKQHQLIEHFLACDHTNEPRLRAHILGFIQNVRPKTWHLTTA